ncbi:hypothetical protein V1478_013561 [Vespula squamosa]|uniref:Uncharacterized protein n=1 Tax=Vespula squamosa TaxID=30214 RepID=A0ABD2A7W0_VESSQ
MSITWLSTDLGASKCYRRCAISSGLPICLQSHLTQLLPLPPPPPPAPAPPSSQPPPIIKMSDIKLSIITSRGISITWRDTQESIKASDRVFSIHGKEPTIREKLKASKKKEDLTKRQALASRPSFTKSSILLIYPLAKAYYRVPRSCQITTARVTAKNGVGSLPRTPSKILSP